MTDPYKDKTFTEIWRENETAEYRRRRKWNIAGWSLLAAFLVMVVGLPFPMSKWNIRLLSSVVGVLMIACLFSGCYCLLKASWSRKRV